MHKIALSLVTLALALAAQADIVGKWTGAPEMTGIKISGGSMKAPSILLELRKDGTYTNTIQQPNGEKKITGKWVRKGSDLKLTPDKRTDNARPAITISKDEKQLTMKVKAQMGSPKDVEKSGITMELKVVFKRV